jgi:hypothetical protein
MANCQNCSTCLAWLSPTGSPPPDRAYCAARGLNTAPDEVCSQYREFVARVPA